MNSGQNRNTKNDQFPHCNDSSRILGQRVEELERNIETLRQEKQAAEAASQAKSELLANISHELRTPVTAMLGMLKLALRTPLSAEQEEYLNLMQGAGDTLNALINCVLDYSRIEAGQLHMEKIPFSLRQNIKGTLDMLTIGAKQKGLTLACDVAPEVPDVLLGDPLRLRQVLVNLVSNAIKFTSRGEIILGVDLHMEDNHEVCCHFSVRDNGIGIANEQQARIFEPFQQAEASTCRVYGGTGLGLSICAQLVALMNGRIWLDSAPGCGSTFHFTAHFTCEYLPRKVIVHSRARQPRNLSLVGRSHITELSEGKYSILLVEDDPTNRRLAQLLLEQAGHRVILADSGAAALATLQNTSCDLVLMDLQMSGMNGLQTAATIRHQEARRGGHLPIIALTAHAQPHDFARCLQAGMDACLTKPVDPTRLYAAIEKVRQHTVAPLIRRHSNLVLNRSTLLLRVHGDMQLLDEIRQLFLRDYGKLMADIRTGLSTQDIDRSNRSLHTLLGMLRSLAAEASQELIEQLEKRCEVGDWDGADIVYTRLEIQIAALRSALCGLALMGGAPLTVKLWNLRKHATRKGYRPPGKSWTSDGKHPPVTLKRGPDARFESSKRKGAGL